MRWFLWYPYPLNVERMNEAIQCLRGEHDFTSFRAANCQSATAMRHVDFCEVSRRGDCVLVDIQANAFLYHMVRNIVGSLLPIGDGRRSPNWMAELLTARDRALAAATAPAQGLYLVSVNYPPCYNLHPSSQSNKDTI